MNKYESTVKGMKEPVIDYKAMAEDLTNTLAYLYTCYKQGSKLLDHVEDEIKEIINFEPDCK